MIQDTAVLKTYLKRLTNLSHRNKSLLLSGLSSEQFLDIHELSFVDNKPSFETVGQLIAQKSIVRLCEIADPRLEKVNEISKRLRKIARTEKFIAEERGSQDLYVGWPFVRGKLSDGTVIHAPFLFFPVSLEQTEKHWQLRRRPEAITLNRSFLLAYSHFNQVKISDEFLEANLDEFDKDSLNFRTQLYDFLKDSPVNLNFNQDIFQDKLDWFDAQKVTDLDLLEKNGELKLYPEAVLGIFPQAGSYLAPDYEKLIVDSQKSVVGVQRTVYNKPPKESETFTVFEQDASQELALKKVKQGESVVVQGPPGSGKSQLIANLIADFTARGKKVLLVCQKRVALDVVYDRLRQIGATDFVALIHDFKNDRSALYKQLSTQIDEVETYKKQNYSLDALMLERQFLQTSRAIDQAAAELEECKKALFDESYCGLSVRELYRSSNPSDLQLDLGDAYKYFKFNNLAKFEQKIKAYFQYLTQISETYFWHDRVSFADFNFTDLQQIEKIITEIPAETKTFKARFFELELNFPLPLRTETLKTTQNFSIAVSQWRLAKWLSTDKEALKLTKTFVGKIKQYQESGLLGDECLSENLGLFGLRLDRIVAARQSILKWPFYGDKTYFRTIAAKYGLGLDFYDLLKIKEKLERRLAFEKELIEFEEIINTKLVNSELSETFNHIEAFKNDFEAAQVFLNNIEKADELVRELFKNHNDLIDFERAVSSLNQLQKDIATKKRQWIKYLTDRQIESLIDSPQLGYSPAHCFDLLVEADKIKESFSTIEWGIVEKLAEFTQPQIAIFQNSLRLAWLRHIEDKNPILRGVSSLKINQLEESLQQNISLKQQLSQEILRLKLREQTYQDLEFNRLNNRVSFRELYHQTTKKRKIWSVRKLLESHAEEVFKLVPCWLTSPESASAIFPLTEGLFDLVIFDEASQCYAEYGIPALHRAKQFVVVGDSKQLTPSDLYKIRFEADEENPDVEIDSLLDLVAQYVPQTMLQGHYRSHTLDLIAFSNQHFYQNKLQLLPYFKDVDRHQPAIKYLRVLGEWKNNTNSVEAEKIVELVLELSEKQPNKSIGIVTFNYQQQQLIQELVEEIILLKNSPSGLGANLFIKNIENVQGDERDIIIFSVGYAPDSRGVVKAQFGSLNAQGGENRLNVAVTRAKEYIYLVTSVLPNQLSVENTIHEGPKLFKKYLEYALEVSEGGFEQKRPFADTNLKNNDLILTDGEAYHASLSAKEAHAYLPLQLRKKGWAYNRIWSRELWRGTATNNQFEYRDNQ